MINTISKARTSNLLELIGSLGKAEKRYFRIYSAKKLAGKDPVYLELFDRLGRQKEYNEAALLASKRIKPQQLPNLKRYLYDLILDSLADFHESSNIETQIKRLLRQVDVLFRRSLYRQCRGLLQKAGNLAREYEKHLLLMEVQEWELRLLFVELDLKNMRSSIKLLFNERSEIISRYSTESKYNELAAHMAFINLQDRQARLEQLRKKQDAIIRHPLLKNEKNVRSTKAYFLHHHTLGRHYLTRGDYESFYKHSRLLDECIRKNTRYFKDNLKDKLDALYAVVLSSIYTRRFGSSLTERLGELKATAAELGHPVVKIYILELGVYVTTGNFKQGLSVLAEIDRTAAMHHKNNTIVDVLFLEYMMMYICFGNERYKQALKHLNNVLNHAEIDKAPELYCFARIMQLVIHYEMSNTDLLPYLVRSTQRFLQSRSVLFGFESMMLEFMGDTLPRLNTKKELTAALSRLKASIEKLAADPEEAKMLNYFDFAAWLESKISRKTLGEAISEKVTGAG